MKPLRKSAKKSVTGLSTGRRGSQAPRPYHDTVNAILSVIRSIPRGRIAAYGQVAAMAGQPRGARQVARILHSLSESQGLPWHRVVNRSGGISLPIPGPGALQAALLRKEKVDVDERGRIDIDRYGWKAGRGSR